MLRLGMVGIAPAIIGCGGSHALDDAGGGEGIDAHDSIDMMRDAPPLLRHASCAYHFGTECRVMCTDAPDVPIELFIEWSSPYCCADMHFGNDDTHYVSCRCLDGLIQCMAPNLGTGLEYEIPWTGCDLYGISPDAGM
jgi:hypothetical protein